MIVVKLGGSIMESGALSRMLPLLAGGRGRAVLVPGGGPFADTVRAEQRRHKFSDSAAHRMALLAMEQYAMMLADGHPSLSPARDIAVIKAALGEGKVPVWLPQELVAGDVTIPESWDVTSDSLAAWLARRLEARRLILIKSVAAPYPLAADALAAAGLVDKAFPHFVADLPAILDWIGPSDVHRLSRLLLD